MKFFVENQKVEKEFNWVLAQVRLHMNGATTAQMEASGIVYRINYGVGIPHLKQLAKKIPVSFELAERLWYSEIREGMLLAALMVSSEKMSPTVCNEWVQQINNKDLVESTAMFLWSRLDCIEVILSDWLNSDNSYLKATTLYTIGRMLQDGKGYDGLPAKELIKLIKPIDELFVYKGLSFALRMRMRAQQHEIVIVKDFITELESSDVAYKQLLGQELKSEVEFLTNK